MWKPSQQQQINKILQKHELWDESGGKEGKRANFEKLNLEGADLSGANLKRIYFVCANLKGADLEGTDLAGANLEEANLSGANLEGCSLKKVYSLHNTIGDGKRIQSHNMGRYWVNIYDDRIQIGCENHSMHDWFSFTDYEIWIMDVEGHQAGLDWWLANNEMIYLLCEEYKKRK